MARRQWAGTADVAGATSGIAEAFSNPVQHIREDFGTARLDQTFRTRIRLPAFTPIDDSHGNSPTNNPITLRRHFPARAGGQPERNARLFAQPVSTRRRSDFPAGRFISIAESPCSFARLDSRRAAGGRGGGRRRHDAQRRVADHQWRHQRRKQSHRGAQPVHRQRSGQLTHGKHLISFGVWFERVQANDNLVQDQYGQASFTNLQTFLQAR